MRDRGRNFRVVDCLCYLVATDQYDAKGSRVGFGNGSFEGWAPED